MLSIALTPFIPSVLACPVNYTLTNPDSSPLASQFSFQKNTTKISIGPTSNTALIAMYSLMLTGTVYLPTPVVATYLISVQIQNQCTGIVCPSPLSAIIAYNIGSPATTQIIDWSLINTICPAISYQAPIVSTTPLSVVNDASVAAMFSMTGNILTIQTRDPSKIGIYSITFTGQIVSGTTITQPCPYTVVIQCTVISISPANTTTPQYYTIGQGQMSINFKHFIQSPVCNYPLTYSVTVKGYSPPPSFINSSFTPYSGGQIMINSSSFSDYTKQTTYIINIGATITMQTPSPISIFSFPLYLSITNIGPPAFSPKLQTMTLIAGQTYNIQFPPMVDPDPLDTPSLSKIDLGTAFSFITGVFPNLVATPGPNDIGTYTISVILQDNNPNPIKATYTMKLIVQSVLQNLTNNNSSNLTSSIISSYFSNVSTKGNTIDPANSIPIIPVIKLISQSGLVTVNFNIPILVPRNFSIIDADILKIDVKPSSRLTNTSFLNITQWNVTCKCIMTVICLAFTNTQMKIQLVFSHPLYVSAGMVTIKTQQRIIEQGST